MARTTGSIINRSAVTCFRTPALLVLVLEVLYEVCAANEAAGNE
jgi:hypothetical protein